MATKVQPTLSLHILNFAPDDYAGDWTHLFAFARACDAAGGSTG